MIKLAIIGYPLGHSLSPIMHKAALDALGIEAQYDLLETKPEDLIDQIKKLKIDNYTGFNITIPLKVWTVPLLTDVDDNANIIGAVNTVIIGKNKELMGYNTDVVGFIDAIPKDLQDNLKSKKAAIFGIGGAARAVAVGLASIGISEIIFYARNVEKSARIKDALTSNFPDLKVKIRQFTDYPDLSQVSIAVNTTPVGMKGDLIGISPISKRSVESLPDDAIVYDLIYNPAKTKLLEYAEDRNIKTINGIDMFVLQGAKALSMWIKQDPPVDVMKEAVIEALAKINN